MQEKVCLDSFSTQLGKKSRQTRRAHRIKRRFFCNTKKKFFPFEERKPIIFFLFSFPLLSREISFFRWKLEGEKNNPPCIIYRPRVKKRSFACLNEAAKCYKIDFFLPFLFLRTANRKLQKTFFSFATIETIIKLAAPTDSAITKKKNPSKCIIDLQWGQFYPQLSSILPRKSRFCLRLDYKVNFHEPQTVTSQNESALTQF